MYKTLYSVTVHPIQGDPVTFTDDPATPRAGSAALAQLTANKDVDSDINLGDHVIIPLHAVDYAEVTEQRTEEEYEDDNAKNCTDGGSGGETGTLTITNERANAATAVQVQLLLGTPATYSGIEFELGEGSPTYIEGVIPQIAAGESFVFEGIPVGTEYSVPEANEAATGTVPGTAILLDQQ